MLDVSCRGRLIRPRCGLSSLCLVLALVGCDGAPQSPPPPNRDLALECNSGTTSSGEAGTTSMDGGVQGLPGCGAGEVCISGRCYAQCAGDNDCGPREMCDTASGTCVRRSGPPPDAGIMPLEDTGPATPCDTVICDDPFVCHPTQGLCVRCSEDTITAGPGEPGHCSGLSPICDIANGVCVTAGPAQCAPCNDNAECDPGDGSFVGECVRRTVMDIVEQVCLQSCSGAIACPAGLNCIDSFCRPPVGASCTTWLGATQRRMCFSDAECNPLGASAAFFVDACQGEVAATAPDGGFPPDASTDAGPGTVGTCVQPCGLTADCFDSAGGQVCMAGNLYCLVPVP